MTPRPNRYHATCADCDSPIPPGMGLLVGKLDDSEDKNWIFRCQYCLAGVLPPPGPGPRPSHRPPSVEWLEAEARRLEAMAVVARRRADAERLAAENRERDARIREQVARARREAEERARREREAARVPEPIRRMGLPWPTDHGAVKARFRQLALKYHPDHGGDGRVFVQLRQCYEQALRLVGGAR